jgi:cytochrome c oxidase subunit 3
MHGGAAMAKSKTEESGSAGGGIPYSGEDGGGLPSLPNTPDRTYMTATLVALAGIAMFFAAFISASVVRQGSPGADWRPLSVPHILWLSTAILLASSFTLAHARNRFLLHDADGFYHWWRITAILGGFFLVGQVIAWRQLASTGIYLATNPASSFFYTLTAAHGLHLAAGLVALLVVALRKVASVTRTATDAISLYWHFMDAIWIVLFFFMRSA